jgi:hypothetical protein
LFLLRVEDSPQLAAESFNKSLMKRFQSAPFQIRNRIDLAGRDVGAAQVMMAVEKKSVPAIL